MPMGVFCCCFFTNVSGKGLSQVSRIEMTRLCLATPIGAAKWQNLSSGLPTKQDSNQSPQLQRLARNWNFVCSKFRYITFQKANDTGADQTARMRRLVCAFVVRKPPDDRFSSVEAHLTPYCKPYWQTVDMERSGSVIECSTWYWGSLVRGTPEAL